MLIFNMVENTAVLRHLGPPPCRKGREADHHTFHDQHGRKGVLP